MITVTDEAKANLIAKLKKENKPCVMLVLDGGGCGGFTVKWLPLSAEDKEKIADEVGFALDLGDGYELVLNKSSEMFLIGSTVKLKEDFAGSSLDLDIPAAISSCGCGASVSFDI